MNCLSVNEQHSLQSKPSSVRWLDVRYQQENHRKVTLPEHPYTQCLHPLESRNIVSTEKERRISSKKRSSPGQHLSCGDHRRSYRFLGSCKQTATTADGVAPLITRLQSQRFHEDISRNTNHATGIRHKSHSSKYEKVFSPDHKNISLFPVNDLLSKLKLIENTSSKHDYKRFHHKAKSSRSSEIALHQKKGAVSPKNRSCLSECLIQHPCPYRLSKLEEFETVKKSHSSSRGKTPAAKAPRMNDSHFFTLIQELYSRNPFAHVPFKKDESENTSRFTNSINARKEIRRNIQQDDPLNNKNKLPKSFAAKTKVSGFFASMPKSVVIPQDALQFPEFKRRKIPTQMNNLFQSCIEKAKQTCSSQQSESTKAATHQSKNDCESSSNCSAKLIYDLSSEEYKNAVDILFRVNDPKQMNRSTSQTRLTNRQQGSSSQLRKQSKLDSCSVFNTTKKSAKSRVFTSFSTKECSAKCTLDNPPTKGSDKSSFPLLSFGQLKDQKTIHFRNHDDDNGGSSHSPDSTDADLAQALKREIERSLSMDPELIYKNFKCLQKKKRPKTKLKDHQVKKSHSSESMRKDAHNTQRHCPRKRKKTKATHCQEVPRHRSLYHVISSVGSEGDDEMDGDDANTLSQMTKQHEMF